jgi:predicted dehydrogenase
MQKYDIPEENVYDYATYDQIADNDAIDIVYVVLPNSLHAEYSIRAAEAGKHVICEKPMATSVEDCRAMIDACERNNRKLSIGYRLHFEPHHQRVMELGQEEVYGPVEIIQAGFGFRLGQPPYPPHIEWRLDQELAGGGALMDVGVYAIQAARYVTGEEPVAATAQQYTTRPDVFSEVDETIFFQLEFPGGARMDGSTSYNGNFNRLYATAEQGWFEVERAVVRLRRDPGAHLRRPDEHPERESAGAADGRVRRVHPGRPGVARARRGRPPRHAGHRSHLRLHRRRRAAHRDRVARRLWTLENDTAEGIRSGLPGGDPAQRLHPQCPGCVIVTL